MAKIFISHSSRDNTFAMEIKEWLESQGFDQSFLDFDKHIGIEPGANWEKTLYREIDRSQAVLLVLTPNWNESKWCFAEYTQARALGKAIFPLTFVTIDDYRTASDTQYLDLTKNKEEGLQQLYEQLRQVALDSQGGFPWDKTRSPFPGLMYFTEEDAAIFFGRDDDVRRVIERLNARRTQGGARLIALLGASGSGKSSLLRAGVLPRMKRDKKNWIVLSTLRPQKNPVHQLARTLAIASDQAVQWKGIYDQLMGDDYRSSLVDYATQIRAVNNVLEPELLISVDQGEELFTIAGQKETKRFFEILNTIQKESLPFITIMAKRSDFLGLLQKQEQLTERFEELSIKPIPLERIEQIIRGPAEVVGLDVEDSFVSAATNDAKTEDALPLLAFALRQLYERFGGDGDLTLEEYHALGDSALGLSPLENTVRSTADDVLRNENPTTEELKALREAFVPELVRINDEGEYVRRPALWDELPVKAYPLLEKLIHARLLILYQDNDKKILEVTHEALLRKWKTLHDWLNEEREFLIGKGRLEQSLIDWQRAEEKQKDLALLSGLQLTRAREWLIGHPRQLTEEEHGYIQCSIEHSDAEQKRKERMRKMLTWGSVAASIILAMAAIFAGLQWQEAEKSKLLAIEQSLLAEEKTVVAANKEKEAKKERDKALITQSLFLADLSAQQLKGNRTTEAVLLATEALPYKKGLINRTDKPFVPEALTSLYSALFQYKEIGMFAQDGGEVRYVAFNSAGTQIITGSSDGKAQIWSIISGELLFILKGHKREVNTAVFSPDGTQVVTASSDKTARLWSATTGSLLFTLKGHKREVNTAVFSPDGTQIVTASSDKTARLWSATTGSLLFTLKGHKREVNTAVFSPDGTQVVTASSDGTAGLWSIGGVLLQLFKGHTAGLSHAAFSPDGAHVVTTSHDKTARIWSTHSGALLHTLEGHQATISEASYSPDGTQIVTASDDNTARLWSAATGVLSHIFKGNKREVKHVAFSPDGTQIVTGAYDRVRLWSAHNGEILLTFEGDIYSVNHVAFSPEGTKLITASKTTRLWNISNNELLKRLEGNKDNVNHATFNPDGTQIVTASSDKTARLWSATTGELLHTLKGHQAGLWSATFNPDGTQIVTASSDKTARLWSATTGELLHTLKGHQAGLWSATFSPDGTQIVTASSDNTARLWSATTGELLHTLKGHNGSVISAVFSADGMQIVTASDDRKASLWSAASGELLHILKGHQAGLWNATFSPDGTQIVTASSDKTARLWSTHSGILLHVFEGHDAGISHATFSPDGTQVVTASSDKTARLWSTHSGILLHVFEGHQDGVMHAAFNLDGTQIVTASWDNTARLWSTHSGEFLYAFEMHKGGLNHVEFSPDGTQIVTASSDGNANIWKNYISTQGVVDYAIKRLKKCLTPEQRKRFYLNETPPFWCGNKWPHKVSNDFK